MVDYSGNRRLVKDSLSHKDIKLVREHLENDPAGGGVAEFYHTGNGNIQFRYHDGIWRETSVQGIRHMQNELRKDRGRY